MLYIHYTNTISNNLCNYIETKLFSNHNTYTYVIIYSLLNLCRSKKSENYSDSINANLKYVCTYYVHTYIFTYFKTKFQLEICKFIIYYVCYIM